MSFFNHSTACALIDRFTLMERIVMRTGWYGFMAVGVFAIYKQAPLWAVVYTVYSILGFALVVLPGLCNHCPYPSQRGTCLFLPPGLVNRFYPYKGPQMSPAAKIAVFAVMAGMVIMPLVWLISDLPMLMLFLLLCLPTLAVILMHYCKRCRHFGCPLNKASDLNARQI